MIMPPCVAPAVPPRGVGETARRAAADDRPVVLFHPARPLTRDEVRALADEAVDEIMRRRAA